MGLEVGGKRDTEEKKKEKIPHMYESIGHQPIWENQEWLTGHSSIYFSLGKVREIVPPSI